MSLWQQTLTSVDNGTVDALKQAQASQGDMFGLLSWVRDQTDAISALLMKKDVPLTALLIALLIAFGMGAAHALSPGTVRPLWRLTSSARKARLNTQSSWVLRSPLPIR